MKTARPVVSVLMPSLNVGAFVRECLASVVSQTLKDIEIICIDAGSTDGTLDVLESFAAMDARVRVLRSEKKSYGYQMNMGIDAATGKYIGIVETDDVASPDMYQRMVAVAEANDVEVLKTDIIRFTGDRTACVPTISPCVSNPRLYGRVLDPKKEPQVVQFSLNQGNLIRRDFVLERGIRFNETPGASYQDVGFYLQTHLQAKRILCLNEAFYWYRTDNPNSSINNPSKAYMSCGEIAFARERIGANPDVSSFAPALITREMYFSYWATMQRVAPELKREFIHRCSADLRAAFARGELRHEMFGAVTWRRMLDIMLSPDAFFYEYFVTTGKAPSPYPERCEITVSLTSWPKRIGTVARVIANMLAQTRPPDRVVLYLADEEFPDRVLPASLREVLGDSRVEVRYTENVKSHKKHVRAFADFPSSAIVMVDDDIVYPETMLAALEDTARRYPYAVACFRSHTIAMSRDGSFASYAAWMKERKIVGRPSMLPLATTGGGTLFPPGLMPQSASDASVFMRIAPTADDLWIKWHLLMAGVPVVFVNGYGKPLLETLEGTQDKRLCDVNVAEGKNDEVWQALQDEYPECAGLLKQLLYLDYADRFPSRVAPELGWWVRKTRGYRLCIEENGWWYTFFHLFEKMFGTGARAFHAIAERRTGFRRRVRLPGEDGRPAAIPEDPVKVSVIMPVYNVAEYLDQCLDSVLGQTLREIEVIAMNDGSTDGSLEILRQRAKMDARLIVHDRPNRNAAVERNEALSLAQGTFVAFCDPDDFYPDPTWLEKTYALARKTGVRAACGWFERFNPDQPDVVVRPPSFAFLRPGLADYAAHPFDFGYQMFIFDRRMLASGNIRFLNVSRYQDPPFMVRAMTAAGRYAVGDVAAYRYRLGHQNVNWAKNDYEKARDMFRSMREVVAFADEHGLNRLIKTTRQRIDVDYREQLFERHPEVRDLPEYRDLMAVLDIKDGNGIESK